MAKSQKGTSKKSLASALAGSLHDRSRLLEFRHDRPHQYLGPQATKVGRKKGILFRAFHPDAVSMEILLPGAEPLQLNALPPDVEPSAAKPAYGENLPEVSEHTPTGLFAAWQPGLKFTEKDSYRLRIGFADGSVWERDDPYRFPPSLSEFDLYLFGEGTHKRLWDCLGARPMTLQGVEGFAFSVWAPNAQRVSVVGDFNHWDGRLFPMQRLGTSGVFDIFLPGFSSLQNYKFEIVGADGTRFLKADPMARLAERPPATASRTYRSEYQWQDEEWMAARPSNDVLRQPMAIYEVHLGSWLRGMETGTAAADFAILDGPTTFGDRLLNYRELAPRLVEHVRRLGFNYIELLPVAEYPYGGSWGYQITGYFAPTSRHGEPDDFRYFVDYCHGNGIGVIIDWVPAHFVKDAHGLGRFDGTALYEHADPRQGEHPDWGTYIFNYSRYEVRSFLIANALYWMDEFHVDGLRVDAVASMLYLDYSREEGEWLPNSQGGRENLHALSLLQAVNQAIEEEHPGHFAVAEESTAWPGITRPVAEGGLGFRLKWNMGWMHDTLNYFAVDPLFRAGCHDQLTFAMVYEYSEHFVNPLSHDEVVHGKGSLFNKMPGDAWQKMANLRAVVLYQMTRPGKKLLFMGSELAPSREWNFEMSLDWYLLGDPARKGFFDFVCALGELYQERSCLWKADPDPDGFQWIACHDRTRSVFSYERRCDPVVAEPRLKEISTPEEGGVSEEASFPEDAYEDRLLIVLNLTPVPRKEYRIGAPIPGKYRCLLSSDEKRYGGSGYPMPTEWKSEEVGTDGCKNSLSLTLPPLSALVLELVSTK